MLLYHNPRCSKSREALALLQELGHAPEIVDYLSHPPTLSQLRQLCSLLGGGARALLRDGETLYGELQLQRPELSDEALLQALAQHPQLLQRPIVVQGQRALIARPPELLRPWLDAAAPQS
ncbi:arsenate reductase (glutaredoxin) [Roseateles sp. BYS180W]|uniref:Arsenate reductase n=1 Tax=Roseateles rivi TaxID=3299028 RepID=A0ABW7FSE6_9BURK